MYNTKLLIGDKTIFCRETSNSIYLRVERNPKIPFTFK